MSSRYDASSPIYQLTTEEVAEILAFQRLHILNHVFVELIQQDIYKMSPTVVEFARDAGSKLESLDPESLAPGVLTLIWNLCNLRGMNMNAPIPQALRLFSYQASSFLDFETQCLGIEVENANFTLHMDIESFSFVNHSLPYFDQFDDYEVAQVVEVIVADLIPRYPDVLGLIQKLAVTLRLGSGPYRRVGDFPEDIRIALRKRLETRREAMGYRDWWEMFPERLETLLLRGKERGSLGFRVTLGSDKPDNHLLRRSRRG